VRRMTCQGTRPLYRHDGITFLRITRTVYEFPKARRYRRALRFGIICRQQVPGNDSKHRRVGTNSWPSRAVVASPFIQKRPQLGSHRGEPRSRQAGFQRFARLGLGTRSTIYATLVANDPRYRYIATWGAQRLNFVCSPNLAPYQRLLRKNSHKIATIMIIHSRGWTTRPSTAAMITMITAMSMSSNTVGPVPGHTTGQTSKRSRCRKL
jgi:hypothetical protein